MYSIVTVSTLVAGTFVLRNALAQGARLEALLLAAKLEALPEDNVEARLQLHRQKRHALGRQLHDPLEELVVRHSDTFRGQLARQHRLDLLVGQVLDAQQQVGAVRALRRRGFLSIGPFNHVLDEMDRQRLHRRVRALPRPQPGEQRPVHPRQFGHVQQAEPPLLPRRLELLRQVGKLFEVRGALLMPRDECRQFLRDLLADLALLGNTQFLHAGRNCRPYPCSVRCVYRRSRHPQESIPVHFRPYSWLPGPTSPVPIPAAGGRSVTCSPRWRHETDP